MELKIHIIIWTVVLAMIAPSMAIAEDGGDRSTLQERYASKDGRLFGHLAATTMVRDDFYRSLGYGFDAGYYLSETWGLELRVQNFHTRLSHTGDQMRRDHDLVPDMRAPSATLGAGARFSWGYGKVLTLGNFVVHFDPQLVAHGGITFAEERLVPMTTLGVGFLSHWQYDIQIKLDLQMSLHVEQRDRGIVPAIGFVPVLAVGWSPSFEGDQ